MIAFIERKIERIRNMFNKNDGLSTDLSTIIPQRRSIIAIIVHFGNKKDTDLLVASLKTGTRPPDQVVVINNNEKNVGYIAGLRAGALKSRNSGFSSNDLLVLLNNDVQVHNRFIALIEEWWSKNGSRSVLAGPTLGAVSLLTGRAHVGSHVSGFLHRPYVHGACMILERSLFEEVSDFEHLFMYWEDVAMSFLVTSLGGRVLHIPDLGITHDDALQKVADQKLYYLVRNGAHVLEGLSLPWGAYWTVMNSLRRVYHRVRGNSVIADALRDKKYLV